MDTNTQLAIDVPRELSEAAQRIGIAVADTADILGGFAPFWRTYHDLAPLAAAVGGDEPKKARELRLRLRQLRTDSERKRKDLKDASLRRGQAIDGLQRAFEHAVFPIESALEAIEKAEERKEAARKAALAAERAVELVLYADPSRYQGLGDMDDAEFARVLAGAKFAKQAADDQARREREEREQREAEAREERERLRAEAETARAEKAKADADAAKARAERDRLQAQADAKAAAERRERDAQAERERKAAAAPDRERLLEFAFQLASLKVPEMATPGGKFAASKLQAEMVALVERLQVAAERL